MLTSISAPSAPFYPSMKRLAPLPVIFALAFHLLAVFRPAGAASLSPSIISPAASSVVRTQRTPPFRDLRPPPSGHPNTDSSSSSVASTFEHDPGFTLDDQGRIYCSERPVGHYTDPGRLTCSRWLYCDGTGHHQWFYCPEGTFFKEDSKSCDFYDELVCLNEEERASRLLLRQTVLLPSSSNGIKDHEQTNFGFINDNELIDVGAGFVTSSIKEDKEARESPGKSSALWWRQPRMRQKQKNSRYTKAVEKFYPVAQHQRQLSTKKQPETFFRANNSSKLSHQENNDVTRASFSAVRHVKQQHAASNEDESLPTLTFESVPHSKMLKASEEGRKRNSDNETQVFAFYDSSSPSAKLEETNITSWKDFEGESRSGEGNTAATTSEPPLDLSPVYKHPAPSSSDSNDTRQSFSQVIYSVPDTADKMASESKYRYPVLDEYSVGHRLYRPESYGAASHEPSGFAGDEDDDLKPQFLPNIQPPSHPIAMTSPSPILSPNVRHKYDPVLAFSREFLDDDDDDDDVMVRDPAEITNHSPTPLGGAAGTKDVTAGSPFGPDYDVPEDSAPYNEPPAIRERKHQFRTDKNPNPADESIDDEPFPKVMTSSDVEDLSFRGFLDRGNKDRHGNRHKGYNRDQKYRYEAEYDDPSPYFSPSGPRRPPTARPQSHPSISYEDIPSTGNDEQYDDKAPPALYEHQHTRQEHGKQLRYNHEKPPRRHPSHPARPPASLPPRPSHNSIYGNNRYPAHSIPHQARQHPTASPVHSSDDYVTAAGGTDGADDLPGSQPVGLELIREPPPPTRHSAPHRGHHQEPDALGTTRGNKGRHQQASFHTGRFRHGTGGQEHGGVNGEPHEGRNYPQPPVSFVVEDYENTQKPPGPIHHYPPYRPKYQESHATAGDEHQQEDKTEAEREEEETFLAWLDHQNAINYRLLFGEEQPAQQLQHQQQSQEQPPYPATANVGSQSDAGGAGGGHAQMLGPVMINGYPITQEHFIDDDGGAGWQSEEQHHGEYKGSKAMITAVAGGDAVQHGTIRPTWQSFEHYSPPPSGGQSKKPFNVQAINEEQRPSSALDKSKLEQLMETDDSAPEDEPSSVPQGGYPTDGGIDDTRRARQRDYYGRNPRINFSSKYASHGKYYYVSPVRADQAKKQKQKMGFSSLEMRVESGESR